MSEASLSYESSGVNYDQLDTFKRACQKAATATSDALGATACPSRPGSAVKARI